MISIPLHSTTNSYHLGNNDEVVDEYGYVSQVTNYYPFGAPYADATAVKNADFQPYKYNGKELDLMHGLNTYDYGARQHDPILARWDRMDPHCESYYPHSPFNYCVNNPVNVIDPDGKDGYLIIWASSDGQYGHAAFAVDNHDFDNTTLAPCPESNGTLTVYDLFPQGDYDVFDAIFDTSVPASYEGESYKLDDIKKNGTVREDKKPDGIIRLKGNKSDNELKTIMENLQDVHKNYKGQSWNCSTYAREGVRAATGTEVKGEETSKGIFSDYNYVTPNALYEATKKLNGATIVMDAGNKTNYKFESKRSNSSKTKK